MKPPICLLLPVVAMTLAATFAQDTPKVQSETKGKDKTASQAKALPKSQTDLIPGSGENRATPPDLIKVMPGFEVELLYSVPSEEQGSWVALCLDDKGRFYVGDQYGGLYRFLAPPPGQAVDPQTVEKVPAAIRGVNGLHFADGVLFANVNDNEKKIPSGFYKVTDSDGDDRLDRVELLREMNPGGDHGLHGIVPVPDSDDLYLICGNRVAPTEAVSTSPMLKNWGEDQLLPRMPDGRGHNRHVLAPGGMIYRVSRDGKRFSLVAGGFRNIYDAAVNSAGELFTYDSDMEWDMNTPWYRPTRVNHVISGGEFGWRNGAGKRPEFYADNLPATLNIGPGSPTGTTFGYGAKFPAKYQQALFGLDWSWGKIYAIHLEAKGASYTGTKEEFISGTPLPVTDVVIRPQDGAMYFTVGGRRVQSGFYRVTYVGGEDASPAPLDITLTAEAKLRRELEAFHIKTDPEAVAAAWPHLAHPDRYVRWAARTAIEHQPLDSWKSKALSETDPEKQLGALLALCRAGGVCPYHRVPPKPLGVPPGEKR
ncbi:MAG: heme-binding protein, partial [Chthoniobacteraceae bacterium]